MAAFEDGSGGRAALGPAGRAAGEGLGLPTAKRLIEAHDGQIAVDCPPEGGTTVVIRLPISTAS